MYKEIKNHFEDNTTYVFKFKGEVYALNGCTIYKHSDESVKEYVYERYDVGDVYGIDIDMAVGDITEDITRSELFFIVSDVDFNIFNQQYSCDGWDFDMSYGIVDIKKWYLSDIHTVIKHIKQGNDYFTRSIFNHKDLKDLPHHYLRYEVLTHIIKNDLCMNNFGMLDNFFSIMSKEYDTKRSLNDLKDKVVRHIFREQYSRTSNPFYRETIVNSLVEYIRDTHGVEGDDSIVPSFISSCIIYNVGFGGRQNDICEVLSSGYFQNNLNEKEFEKLFENIIQQTIYNGDVFGFIRDVQKFPTLRKEITKNKGLLEIFKSLVRVYNLQVGIIQNDHKNMLTWLED